MSSVAYNLTRKMEWMGRRLRYIDEPGLIGEWVVAMTAINTLLKEVESKCCTDDWQPWSKKEGGEKKDLTKEMPRSKRTHGLVELLRLVPEGKKSMEPNKKVRIEGNFPKTGLHGRFLQDGRTMGSSKS